MRRSPEETAKKAPVMPRLVRKVRIVSAPSQHQVRRVVLQHLQSLRSAGVLDLPRDKQRPGDDAAEPGHSADVHSATESREPVPATSEERFVLENSSSRPEEVGTDTDSQDANGILGSSPLLTREQRVAALTSLCDTVAACSRCVELAETRTQTVFGVGHPMARLVFLGEAPGADEDRQGEPFVGRAGQLLTKIIEACTLRREDVYILNILKCRPPGNRTPKPDEVANCHDYLRQQLRIIRPEFICCLGSVAIQNLLDTTKPIGQLRGRIHYWDEIKVVATYHPAYLLRNPNAKRATWDDMKMLMREMGIEIPGS